MSDNLSEKQIPSKEYLIEEIRKMKVELDQLKKLKEKTFPPNKSKTTKNVKKLDVKKKTTKKVTRKRVKETDANKKETKKVVRKKAKSQKRGKTGRKGS